jgi:hypothetical protein
VHAVLQLTVMPRWARWATADGFVIAILLVGIIFHQIQLLACAATASRMPRVEVGDVSSG